MFKELMTNKVKVKFIRGSVQNKNKTKVICADLLDFDCDLDWDLLDIFKFCNISVLVAFFLVIFQFW